MIWALLACVIGAASATLPLPLGVQLVMVAACLGCGYMYVRAMNQRARKDVQ